MPNPPQRRAPTPEVVDYSVDPQAVPVARQVFGEDRLVLFKQQIARGWKRPPTDAELEQMAMVYQRLRYDPWARPAQLIFTLRWDSSVGTGGGLAMTPQKTIDGLRLDASRSRDYLGQVGPQWCAEDGVWRDIWLRSEPPAAARVGVLRRGFPEPLWSVALWREWVQTTDEYVGGNKTGRKVPSSFWLDKPAHMLAKTAEAMSLKRALPTETDPGELQHVQEMERLALRGNVAMHQRVFGTEEHSAFDLPAGPSSQFVPLSARTDVQDAPRLPAPPVVVDGPPTGKRERPIGELYEEYGRLLTQARHAGVIPEGEVSKWVLPQGAERLMVVERGVALRAALNRATIDRSNANMAAQAAASEGDEDAPEPDFQSELIHEDSAADETDDISSLAMIATDENGLTVHTVEDAEYQRLVTAIHAAAQADLDFDDCKVELPCAVTEIMRKRQALELRLEAVREAMAANPPPRAPANTR